MKPNIHPPYHQAQVHCVCGNTFTVGSTAESIRVDPTVKVLPHTQWTCAW